MSERMQNRILPVIIVVLTLADGILHLSLDFVLFRGNFFGGRPPSGPPPGSPTPVRPGPPPGGGGNPFILPLNELFLLNFIASVVLVLLYWFGRHRLGERRWLLNVLLIAYAGAALVGWFIVGRPNPMGLGYLAKAIEILLIIALVVDIWSIRRPRATIPAPNPAG